MPDFPIGKLPHEYFMSLLRRNEIDDPRVILGPKHGEDAAVLDLNGENFILAKTDPITFATDEIGWYAVNVNANDIAASGGIPAFFMATVLLPENETDEILIDRLFQQIIDACHELNISLVGGHTEVTYGIDRPIIVGMMLGTVEKTRLTRTGDLEVGDSILLTKGYPLEGISIIAREMRDHLLNNFSDGFLDHCASFLHDPGISVVNDARIANLIDGVHAMHDPTEGGVLTGLWEMSEASRRRVVVNLSEALLSEGRLLCEALDLNPWAVIASGGLLLSVSRDAKGEVMNHLSKEGIRCFEIGEVIAGPEGVYDLATGESFPRPIRDEIARLYE